MYSVFYILSGSRILDVQIESRDSLVNILSMLEADSRLAAVKVFAKGATGWYQVSDLYRDVGLGFKGGTAFRPGEFLVEDWRDSWECLIT